MITIKNYKKAESLEEAWQLNQQRGCRILGGMLWLKMGRGTVQTAVDLTGLGLDTIEETSQEFRIGCMVTLRELELHPGMDSYTGGAMKEALRHIVGVQFRNLATVGGSVYGRFGFSDVLTMFMAMDSYVELYRGGVVPMQEFAAMKDERDILVRVIVRKLPACFSYHSVRNSATDFPVLNCAAGCFKEVEASDFEVSDAGLSVPVGYRVAVGARPARAILVQDEENILSGPITCDKARAFGEYAAAHVLTGSNLRGSAQYRSHLVKVLAERAVSESGGIRSC